ncbi:hypothetical protein ACWEVD_00615 [Nocardia thailandica]
MRLTVRGEGVGKEEAGAAMYARYFQGVTEWAAHQVRADGIECVYGDYLRPREAARLCAHAIRFEALRCEDGSAMWAHGITGGGLVGAEVAAAIDSTDIDERMAAAMDLHRGLRGLGIEATPAREVARWLGRDADDVASAGHLARWTSHTNRGEELRNDGLWLAWWAIHAGDVIDELGVEPVSERGGRPPLTDSARRELLRTTVRRMHQTGLWTKASIAARAGISRPTLNQWLGDTTAAAGPR